MAKSRSQDITQTSTNTFVKGLNKDSDPSFVSEGMWTHARNAVNNTAEGDLGTISNESANYLCATTAETILNGRKVIVGAIHLYSDKWVIYTAVHVSGQLESINSEIGLFEEDQCKYRPIVQDPCLNLNELNLITGASREKEDCSWAAYWSDGLNPDRYLNIGDPQTWPTDDYVYTGNNIYTNSAGDELQWPGVTWNQDCNTVNDCIICEDLQTLNCDKIRLARLMKTPCLKVSAGKAGGTLRNGSYFATIAYSIRGQKVTDWFSPSNVQPLWFDLDPSGALEIDIEADTENFEEFILVVVSNINQGAVARRIGIYSTSTQKIYIDQIKEDLLPVPIEQLPIQTPIFEKSDQIVEVNNYLLRVGPTSKFDFNYQPLANLIQAKWVSVEYPANYYLEGGHKPSYLRDEVYSFFIRWIYDTGDKSSSYHIPGRPARRITVPCSTNTALETEEYADPNTLFNPEKVFEVYNTATGSISTGTLEDGGRIVAKGDMGYWESTEIYPDNRADIWNSSEYCWTGVVNNDYDLCGKPIRHHKFPDHGIGNSGFTQLVQHFRKDPATEEMFIRLLGVEFDNITYPKDQDGNDIPGIVGYEILRGSREGNKSIVAKGMLNNMRPYKIKGTAASPARKGLYPNHPFNTINAPGMTGFTDPYIVYNRAQNSSPANPNPLNPADDSRNVPSHIITFHSPDTNFKNPFLSTPELKVYGSLAGTSIQQFIEPDQHPQAKLLANLAMWMIIVGGIIEAIIANLGKRTINQPGASYTRKFDGFYNQEANSGGNGTLTQTGTFGGVLGTGVGTFTGNGTWQPIGGNNGETEEYEFTDPEYNNTFEGNAEQFNQDFLDYLNGGAFDEALDNGNTLQGLYDEFNLNTGNLKGGTYTAPNYTTELSGWQYFQGNGPTQQALSIGTDAAKFLYYFSEGADVTLRIIYALLPFRQYALQMIAHGPYDVFNAAACNTIKRFKIEDMFYLNNNIQDMKSFIEGGTTTQYRINNLKRQTTVTIRTKSGAGADIGPSLLSTDNSLVTLGTAIDYPLPGVTSELGWKDETKTAEFSRKIESYYAGLKYRIVNQYGQLQSIKQIPITPCEQKFEYDDLTPVTVGGTIDCPFQYTQKKISTSPILFNGDTYINRYTEKNSMFFFYDWLYGQPNGYEYNYYTRQLIPEPRFKINTERYEVSNLNPFQSGPFPSINPPSSLGSGILPNSFYRLDNENYDYSTDQVPGILGFTYPIADGYPGLFGVKESYFYLSTSSVRDFFVESDVIVDFREPGTQPWQRFYSPYYFTDLASLFNINPENITRGNFYSYDYSLSISKLFTQYFSQGNLQSRYYNPEVAKLCYTYYPDRIIYSLPQEFESAKDSWFIYLANNYKEFKDQISGVKNFAKTGIFITFKNSSPLVFQGVDQLQTDFGTKITIGDGGLFAQAPQSVVISDREYEYGSSQNLRSIISTPAGMYYMSQNQGKIMSYIGNLDEISQNGMKWWFTLFLPYKLTDDFPDYPHTDNPVAGIGCQSIYDNLNSILYFTKKDYKLKPEFKGRVIYDASTNDFIIDDIARFKLNDLDNPAFESASWTISYDPKTKFWISFHDWHPDLLMAGKNTFLSTKNNTIWKHNYQCDQFCNYYGVNYPFEIELPVAMGQTVTTVKSMEYILEAYRRNPGNCVDQYHVLDYNFDKAVVYNTEQVSGYLNLNLYPKNNIALSQQYPQVNINSIDILFSKEEQKYRFNQFWDITKDRGEFPIGSNYPPTGPVIPGTTILDGPTDQQNIWITQANGYIKQLNPTNLDYSKPELQRKRFRHYLNFLFLSKQVSVDTNVILKIVNTKKTYSPR
jgi:hypothetical protein